MHFNNTDLIVSRTEASFIKRKNESNTSIDVYFKDNRFISLTINDDFDPRNININEKINLINHINWDVSFKDNEMSYTFDITKDKVELTRLSDTLYKLEVEITNPDMIYSSPEDKKTFDSLEFNAEFSFVYEDIKCMLASTLDLSDKDEFGNKVSKVFDNKNHKLDIIKKYVKKYDNFLYIASTEYENEINDKYAKVVFDSFELTLPFKNYQLLDSRTESKAEELIKNADLILLSGGHVPTQNEFFNNINLRELIRNTDAFIIGVSAGSMNSAENVYAPPEYEEEVLDKNYNKYYQGLGLTHLNVFPHYDEIKDEVISGVHVLNEIVLPDSYDRDIYALNNGSYILIDDNEYIYGETYLFRNGEIKQVCEDEKSTVNKKWLYR